MSEPVYYIPDGLALEAALRRTTHLAIGAHPDDVEIMAYHGIASCYAESQLWFCAAVMTSGGGGPRAGDYAGLSDPQLAELRREEQRRAAAIGHYGALVQFDYASADLRADPEGLAAAELADLIVRCRPQVVYTHSPFDEHPTHVAVCRAVLAVLRTLPPEFRPRQVLGCEVWGSLDWLGRRIELDCSLKPDLAAELLNAFASQNASGKRYDLAVVARRRANATFAQAREIDRLEQLNFAVDLSAVAAGAATLEELACDCLDEFRLRRLAQLRAQE
ncbi:MAG: GlcNAc-PI de-N-acetylase [Deltaproteobacteria bacterium ADurb.Bin510]|nr:MAG: GlcNAc-PI de-N-acetylase [Deltaproteobacteria bacterium ADurb.Bin510]